MKRRLLNIILALVLCLGMMPVTALAASGDVFTVDGVTYEVLTEDAESATGTVQVGNNIGSVDTAVTSVTIPETVGYGGVTYTVTAVGIWAFSDCTALISVTLPDTVTEIGYGAFLYCSGLTSITLPDGVTSIGERAFEGCSKLATLEFPDELTEIKSSAFMSSGLTSLDLSGTKVRNIEYNAFACTEALGKAVMPATLETLCEWVFFRSGLTEIDFSRCTRLTKIESGAFAYTQNLKSIRLPASLTTMRGFTFSDSGIENADLSACTKLTILDGNTFARSKVKSVILPSGVNSFYGMDGYNPFCDCPELETVTFLGSTPPKEIDYYSYSEIFSTANCPKLTAIYVPDGSEAAYRAKFGESELADLVRATPEVKKLSVTPDETPNCYTVTFTSNCAGTLYYKIDRSRTADTADLSGWTDGECTEGANTIYLTDQIGGEYLHIAVQNADGQLSRAVTNQIVNEYTALVMGLAAQYTPLIILDIPIYQHDAPSKEGLEELLTGRMNDFFNTFINMLIEEAEASGAGLTEEERKLIKSLTMQVAVNQYAPAVAATADTEGVNGSFIFEIEGTFGGWTSIFSFADEDYQEMDPTVIAEPYYTVTLDTDGGTVKSGNLTGYVYGVGAALPAKVTRAGYLFNGWYDDETGEGVTAISGTDWGDRSFTARWTFISPGSLEPPTYPPTVEQPDEGGTVTVLPKSPEKGDKVTITPKPEDGYEVDEIIVTDRDGNSVKVTDNGDGTYSFTQPEGKVTVRVAFKKIIRTAFADVPADAYYYDAVYWAVDKAITCGTSDTAFSPYDPCTRAQAVTFLWRAAGSPVPKSSEMPFTDIAAGSYCYDAVLWAVENGITAGTSSDTFSPDVICSRAHIVTFLWRYQSSPAADSLNPLTDVEADAYYADAVLWAVENGITNGTSATAFSPNNDCSRAHIVTSLWRCLSK